MLQRVQMFCLCAGLCLYLGFRFRYFPYSLYTFLSVCKSITALSYDWRLSRYRSFQAWLGVGILFLTDCAVVHLLTWTCPRLVLRTKLHGGNNLAFADFEKIHPSARMPGHWNPGVIAGARDVLPSFDCEIPSFQVTALNRGGLIVVCTPAFFGGAPIKMSADILFKDRCSIQLSYGQFIF